MIKKPENHRNLSTTRDRLRRFRATGLLSARRCHGATAAEGRGAGGAITSTSVWPHKRTPTGRGSGCEARLFAFALRLWLHLFLLVFPRLLLGLFLGGELSINGAAVT